MIKGLPPFLFLCLISLAACASPQAAGSGARGGADRGEKQASVEDAAIASALQRLSVQKSDYKISPADLVEITVYQEEDLKRSARVSQNGTISFPLVGTVQIGGLAVIEAEETLAKALRDYLVNPQVTIFIKEYGNKKIFILGEVKSPGSFELPTESKLTVLEALSLAGGFTAIAAPDRTRVIRTVDGKSRTFTIEVSAVTKRGEKDKDIALEPNDVVYVPQSYF